MKITICGSMVFLESMEAAKKQLEEQGHEVHIPKESVKDETGKKITTKEFHKIRHAAKEDDKWVWEEKAKAIKEHFEKVKEAEAILILNHEKKGVKGYVGANTLLEMGLAFHLGKRICLLNEIPEQDYSEEIRGMQPTVLKGNLTINP